MEVAAAGLLVVAAAVAGGGGAVVGVVVVVGRALLGLSGILCVAGRSTYTV